MERDRKVGPVPFLLVRLSVRPFLPYASRSFTPFTSAPRNEWKGEERTEPRDERSG